MKQIKLLSLSVFKKNFIFSFFKSNKEIHRDREKERKRERDKKNKRFLNLFKIFFQNLDNNK